METFVDSRDHNKKDGKMTLQEIVGEFDGYGRPSVTMLVHFYGSYIYFCARKEIV